jgi:succinate dehydrogenase / fumarate reductase membrane anchor subunit
MVENITIMGRSGLRDWLVQRVSAIVLTIYAIFILGFIVWHQPLDYITWHQLFSSNWVRIFSLLSVFSLLLHTWVGIWTIATDYLKCAYIRMSFLLVVMLVLFTCSVWSILILWGL